MITKAIVVSMSKDSYTAKIRIPRYDKTKGAVGAVSDNDLLTAPICTPPGNYPYYQPGDVVFVAFEDEEVEKPVIIGCLYCKDKMLSIADIKVDQLHVTTSSTLNGKTNIDGNKFDDLLKDKSTLTSKVMLIEEQLQGE